MDGEREGGRDVWMRETEGHCLVEKHEAALKGSAGVKSRKDWDLVGAEDPPARTPHPHPTFSKNLR